MLFLPSLSFGGPLYQRFVQYVNNSLKYLRLKNYKVKIEAMCWMQGESDAESYPPWFWPQYECACNRFPDEFRAVRRTQLL